MALKDFPPDFGDPLSFDILVIGGGLAGVCATLAAARLGRTVALVHDRPVLGGNASSEHKVNISGADCSGHSLTRFSRETGIINELALEVYRRAANNATARYIQDWVLYEAVTREPAATLFLNSKALQAIVAADGAIRGVTVTQVSTEKSFALAGKLLIDCSGDGRIAADAGAEFRMGREASSEFDESMAPDRADDHTMGSSIEFICRDMGRPVPFTPPSFAKHFESEDALPFRKPVLEFPDSKFEGCGWWWLEYGGHINTIDDNELIRDELHAALFGLWDYLKNRSGQPLENYALEWIGAMPGKRESRRFVGDYLLNENDVRSNRRFDDAVAYSGWPIDVHPPMGLYDPAPPSTSVRRSDYVTVPLRCLYSKNIPNLFFAGRNISVTHVALGTTRVMGTCAILGQAAGVAAHLCIEHACSPGDLARDHVADVQQLLLRGGCYIPRVRNESVVDLARRAAVTASSDAPLTIEPDDGHGEGVDLAAPCAQLVPISEGRLDAISLLLSSTNDRDTELTLFLALAPHINDVPGDAIIARVRAAVPPGGPRWVRFDTDMTLSPRELVWIMARPAPSITWHARRIAPVGTVRSTYHGDPNGGEGDSAEALFGAPEVKWRSSKGAFCTRLEPQSRPYTSDNVISGTARPEDWAHIWISDPTAELPQHIDLAFDSPQPINTVTIDFDDDLDRNIYQPAAWGGTLGQMTIPTLAKNFTLSIKTPDGWREIAHVTNNHQRRNTLRFDPIDVQTIRIQITETWGDASARIYEVRAYG